MSRGMKYDSGKHDWWENIDRLKSYLVGLDFDWPVAPTQQVLGHLVNMSRPGRDRLWSGVQSLQILYMSLSDQYEAVGKVLAFGERKYARDSWQDVPDAYRRYWSAAVRHLIDEEFVPYGPGHIDAESGLPSWSHCATNIEFLLRLQYPSNE